MPWRINKFFWLLSALKSLNVLIECKVLSAGSRVLYRYSISALGSAHARHGRGVLDGWGRVYVNRYNITPELLRDPVVRETCASRAKSYRNNIILSSYHRNQVITHSSYALCSVCVCVCVCVCYYCLFAINWAQCGVCRTGPVGQRSAGVIVTATC